MRKTYIYACIAISSFIAGMAYRKSFEQPCAVCLAERNMLATSTQSTYKQSRRLYTKKITYTPELYVEADALFHPRQDTKQHQKPQLVAVQMFTRTILLTASNLYDNI